MAVNLLLNAGIVTDFTLADGAYLNPKYLEDLFDQAAMGNFWIPNDDKITVSGGEITSIASMKTGGITLGSVQTASRPGLTEDYIGTFNAMEFVIDPSTYSPRFDKDLTNAHNYLPLETGGDGSWTKIVALEAPAIGDGGPTASIWDSAGAGSDNRHLLRMSYNGANLEFLSHQLTMGATGGPSAICTYASRPVDEPFLWVASFNDTTNKSKQAINGGLIDEQTATAANYAQTSFGSPLSGGSNTGSVFTCLGFGWFKGDLLASENAIYYRMIKQMARDYWGIESAGTTA